MFRPLRAGADLRARVVEVRPETADAVTVVLRPGRAWRGHRPGQYVRHRRRRRRRAAVALLLADLRARRAPTACSRSPPRRSPDGLVSAHLAQRAAAGPAGPPRPGRRRLRAARPGARQGPVRHRRQRHHPGDGHAALRPRPARATSCSCTPSRRADDVIFGAELRALADAGRLRLVEQHTDADGRLDVADARRARARPGRAARPGPAARPACSTRSRSTGPTLGLRRPAAHRAVPRRRWSSPARAAPSRFTARRHRPSRPTARPRSSTPARRPAC